MSPEKETWVDTKARLKTLDHSVEEAREALESSPADPRMQARLDMILSIHAAAREAFAAAEDKLARSGANRDDET